MNLSNWFLRIAVVYLLAGVSLGIFMGASGDHSMFPLHAHINLLGWVSMSLFGFFYGTLHFLAYVVFDRLAGLGAADREAPFAAAARVTSSSDSSFSTVPSVAPSW